MQLIEAIYNYLTGRYYLINVYKGGRIHKIHKVYTSKKYWSLLTEIKWRKGLVWDHFAKIELIENK